MHPFLVLHLIQANQTFFFSSVSSLSSSIHMQNQNNVVPPCALCSACRDWNLGEFCPWDLTGIIGDISTDVFDNEEEAHTVTTKNSSEGGGGEEQDSSSSMDMEPTMPVNFSVPHEISHSKSASDFMSSMADIEAWD